jgi:hypothetical protein
LTKILSTGPIVSLVVCCFSVSLSPSRDSRIPSFGGKP